MTRIARSPLFARFRFLNSTFPYSTDRYDIRPESRAELTNLRRKGAPRSSPIFVAIAIDSLRMLDQALHSGGRPAKFLRQYSFSGMIEKIAFDDDGAVNSLTFGMQEIRNGSAAPVASVP